MRNVLRFWGTTKYVIAAIVVGKSFSLIWKILLARTGSRNLGTVEVLLTVFTVLTMISVMGFQTSLTRYLSVALRKGQYTAILPIISSALKIPIAISLLLAGGFAVAPDVTRLILQNTAQDVRIERFVWALPFFVISEMVLGYFIGRQLTAFYAFGKYIVQPVLRLAFLVLVIASGMPLASGIPYHIVAAGVSGTVILAFLSKPLWHALRYPSGGVQVRQYLAYTIPMSGSLITYSLYGALDTLFLGRYTDIQTVGRYAAIVILAEIPGVVFAPFLNMFHSYLSAYHDDRRRGLAFALLNCALFVAIGIIVGVIVYLARNGIIRAFFSAEYGQFAAILAWLIPIRLAEETLILPLRHALDFYGHVRTTLLLMVLTLAVKLAVAVNAVPLRGVDGIILAQGISVGLHAVLVLAIAGVTLGGYRKTA